MKRFLRNIKFILLALVVWKPDVLLSRAHADIWLHVGDDSYFEGIVRHA